VAVPGISVIIGNVVAVPGISVDYRECFGCREKLCRSA